MVDGRRPRRSATGIASSDSSRHPGLTPAAAAPPPALDLCDEQFLPDQAHFKAGIAAQVDGHRHGRVAAGWDEREVGEAEASEHLANHVAQLAVALSARGARRKLSLDGRPVDAVHPRIEVRVANDGPRGIERLARLGCLRRRKCDNRGGERDRTDPDPRPACHLMSALICVGTAKTDGWTLP